MKKHGISTRIGAIILAASLVAGDALPAFAAQTAGTEPGASTVENKMQIYICSRYICNRSIRDGSRGGN